jgi:hypothetical protein
VDRLLAASRQAVAAEHLFQSRKHTLSVATVAWLFARLLRLGRTQPTPVLTRPPSEESLQQMQLEGMLA